MILRAGLFSIDSCIHAISPFYRLYIRKVHNVSLHIFSLIVIISHPYPPKFVVCLYKSGVLDKEVCPIILYVSLGLYTIKISVCNMVWQLFDTASLYPRCLCFAHHYMVVLKTSTTFLFHRLMTATPVSPCNSHWFAIDNGTITNSLPWRLCGYTFVCPLFDMSIPVPHISTAITVKQDTPTKATLLPVYPSSLQPLSFFKEAYLFHLFILMLSSGFKVDNPSPLPDKHQWLSHQRLVVDGRCFTHA